MSSASWRVAAERALEKASSELPERERSFGSVPHSHQSSVLETYWIAAATVRATW